MSVSVYILNPQNDFEKSFYIPISNEAFHKKYWRKATHELELEWLRFLNLGIDVTEDLLDDILAELMILKKWAETNLSDEDQKYMIERICLLEAHLPEAFQRPGVVVFMG